MVKVYVLSSHPDAEVSDTINRMPVDKLRVALYGIARGYDFDESMDVAILDGTKTNWLSSLEAAEQPLALDVCQYVENGIHDFHKSRIDETCLNCGKRK